MSMGGKCYSPDEEIHQRIDCLDIQGFLTTLCSQTSSHNPTTGHDSKERGRRNWVVKGGRSGRHASLKTR